MAEEGRRKQWGGVIEGEGGRVEMVGHLVLGIGARVVVAVQGNCCAANRLGREGEGQGWRRLASEHWVQVVMAVQGRCCEADSLSKVGGGCSLGLNG